LVSKEYKRFAENTHLLDVDIEPVQKDCGEVLELAGVKPVLSAPSARVGVHPAVEFQLGGVGPVNKFFLARNSLSKLS